MNSMRRRRYALYQLLYERLGFVLCGSEELEPSFEKVSLYADQTGAHAARQVETSRWVRLPPPASSRIRPGTVGRAT
jgi:hypothetical protein